MISHYFAVVKRIGRNVFKSFEVLKYLQARSLEDARCQFCAFLWRPELGYLDEDTIVELLKESIENGFFQDFPKARPLYSEKPFPSLALMDFYKKELYPGYIGEGLYSREDGRPIWLEGWTQATYGDDHFLLVKVGKKTFNAQVKSLGLDMEPLKSL